MSLTIGIVTSFKRHGGEQLYHSVGNKSYPVIHNYRKMIGARVGYEVTIGKHLVFLNRLGFNYNVHPNKLDVTMENYLRWHLPLESVS